MSIKLEKRFGVNLETDAQFVKLNWFKKKIKKVALNVTFKLPLKNEST